MLRAYVGAERLIENLYNGEIELNTPVSMASNEIERRHCATDDRLVRLSDACGSLHDGASVPLRYPKHLYGPEGVRTPDLMTARNRGAFFGVCNYRSRSSPLS
jgi:hypothetical protein